MSSRRGNDNDRYVAPNAERGGWDVVKEDHERSSTLVRNLSGGELRIANKEGQIIDSDAVPRGSESPRRDTR